MNRIKEMLQVAADYIREFCPEQLIAYDETECDGYCVAEDCELAKAELDFQLAQARREGWEQAKEEAFALALNYKGKGCVRSIDAESVSLLIANMPYKEPRDD